MLVFNMNYWIYTENNQSSYEIDRNMLVRLTERPTLFNVKDNLPEDQVVAAAPHYDDVVSIAMGYGFDLLAHSNSEINELLSIANARDSSIAASLSTQDQNNLSEARDLFNAKKFLGANDANTLSNLQGIATARNLSTSGTASDIYDRILSDVASDAGVSADYGNVMDHFV